LIPGLCFAEDTIVRGCIGNFPLEKKTVGFQVGYTNKWRGTKEKLVLLPKLPISLLKDGGQLSWECQQHVGNMLAMCQNVADFGLTCVLVPTQK
jgi:hypothetical protein